jgi:hypothetical protein
LLPGAYANNLSARRARKQEERPMRKTAYLTALAIAGALSFAVAGTAEAAPSSSSLSLPDLQTLSGSNVEPAHCRRYRHCHRRCWRRGWRFHCRRYCHRC